MTEDRLTTRQVADLAAKRGKPVTARYIARLCADGTIEARKSGVYPRQTWLIDREEADRWVAEWVRK